MTKSDNRWAIKKDFKNKKWNVLVDGRFLVSFDTWEECRAMVSYQVRIRPRVEKSAGGGVTMAFDIICLALGIVTGIICVYFGWWTLLPVPVTFILISLRGFLLQDWHHISSQPRYRRVGSK